MQKKKLNMINFSKSMNKKKFYYFIFDLDGVIFDSKKNMNLSWNSTRKKFNLNSNFNEYFKHLGLPFDVIMKKLKIKPSISIKKFYEIKSEENMNYVKPYSGVINFIKILERKKIKYSIVTSKNLKRSKLLLNKFKIFPSSLHCPRSNIKSKPFPDHLLRAIKKNNFQKKKKDVCYVGDTLIDYTAALKANISFVFAKYGYGKLKKKTEVILKFSDLKRYL
jgi:phosphoglycolate phosphatase